MKLTLYTADCRGNQANAVYPHKRVIGGETDFLAAVGYDHVCAAFQNHHRSAEHFLESDVDVMDCDNDHSENPGDWIYPETYGKLFSAIDYIVVPSRHNMMPKDGKSARPRNHVYFPHERITDVKQCAALKAAILERYPFFDPKAADAARFIFGNPTDSVIWHEGEFTIECLLRPQARSIPEGRRNSTLSHFAGRVLKRYGVTDRAYGIFLEEAARCEPPLEDAELSTIWKSACRFYERIRNQPGYVSPEQYNADFQSQSLRPTDYSDIGQAKALVREYHDELKYTTATDYLRYDGKFWEESRQRSVGAMEEFLDLQLEDAKDEVDRTTRALMGMGVAEKDISSGGKALEKKIETQQVKTYLKYTSALTYRAFVLKRRDMKYVMSALQAAKPMLEVKPEDLDRAPFLLNCQDGTYDLTRGMDGRMAHNPDDLITKITAFAPGDEGKELWLDAVNRTFCGDVELIDYVQQIAGLGAIGMVYLEALIISYGEGSNGKSTFWNSVAGALGSYSGNISADTLTVGCKRNVKPEIAEVKGKRLLIAAELEEGMRLSTSIVKQLCSTDQIKGEKKYKDPFDFKPSHTLVLYTNHLPRVGGMDTGIWRRLIVIPFQAKIKGNGDKKNYSTHLLKHAGPYILKWIIEGAQKAIRCDFRFTLPVCVEEAIRNYKRDNDWLGHFMEECCELGDSLEERSGEVYQAYRAYCARVGEFTRSTAEFYNALEVYGIRRRRTKKGVLLMGMRLSQHESL